MLCRGRRVGLRRLGVEVDVDVVVKVDMRLS